MDEVVTAVASGFKKLGLEKGDKVGIFAKNCPEWSLTDYACAVQSLVSVPVYDSYQPAECKYIMIHSDMKAIVLTVDKVQFVGEILKSGEAPELRFIIMIDDLFHPAAPRPENVSYKFSELIELGKQNIVPDVLPQPDDLYTIVYTSGTTGTPKGAMITHKNAATGAILLMTRSTPPPPGQQGIYTYFFYFSLYFFDFLLILSFFPFLFSRLSSLVSPTRPHLRTYS